MEELAQWTPQASSAYLYVSVAKGTSSNTSDVNIFIIRPDHVALVDRSWERQIFDLKVANPKWIGNQAEITEHSESEWDLLGKQRYNLVTQIESSGLKFFPVTVLEAQIRGLCEDSDNLKRLGSQ
jgi:hypothetical protein